jgi:hypothetical protein
MISFTDMELRTTSGVILETPQELAQTIANKAAAIVGKADALVKDQANEVFYSSALAIVDQYHAELEALNGSQRTTYDDADLQSGGALAAGNPHFPESPIWVKFPPKMIASQNGNPSASLSDHEIFRLGELNEAIDLMKNGFTDGAISTTLTAPYSGGPTLEIMSGAFVTGDRIVVYGSGFSALLEVVSVTVVPPVVLPLPLPGYTGVTCTVLAAPNGTIPIGGVVQNFFAGFNNTQRESGVSIYDEVFEYFKTLIIQEKDALDLFLSDQKAALLLNEAVGAEGTANTTAQTDVDTAQNSITTWEGLAETGAGSKYGDTGIANLDSVITNRSSQAPARATAIGTYLGSVSQAGDGAYSGSGQYNTLSTWINLRINKSAGSLRIWYDFDLIISFIDAQIAIITQKKLEYDAYMIVKRIVSNPNGTAVIGLEDVASLVIGDSIKIIDDTQPSMVALINNIVGNIVTLDTIVPATYTIANNARLIKLL